MDAELRMLPLGSPLIWLICLLIFHAGQGLSQITTPSWAIVDQNLTNFVGWYYATGDSTPKLLVLPTGETLTTQNAYIANCYLSTKCAILTTCTQGTLFYDVDGSAYSTFCPSSSSCNQLVRYQTYPAGAPAYVWWLCTDNPVPTAYLEWPGILTSTSQTDTTTRTTLATTTANPAATATTPTPTATAASSTPPPTATSSKKWIAGPVVGAVVGLAVLGGGAYLFNRRHRQNTQPAGHDESPTTEDGSPVQQTQEPYQQVPHELSGEDGRHEMYQDNTSPKEPARIHELQG